MTSTLVHTSSRDEDNMVRIARVAAANRVAEQRVASRIAQARRRAHAVVVANAFVATLRAQGAIEVGFKICTNEGKRRFSTRVEDAASVLVDYFGQDVEAWGVTRDREYCAEVW